MKPSTLTSISLILVLLSGCDQPQQQVQPQPKPTVPNSDLVKLEVSEGTNMALAVSSDGGSAVLSLQGTLYSLSPDGGQATALTDSYFDAREPAFSRDGEKIVFHGYRNGNWDIWQVDHDGASAVALTDDAFDDREPMPSPVADEIVFSSDRSGNYDLWLLDASGDLAQLTTDSANDHSPAWSPDGNTIAYATDSGGGGYTLNLLDVSTQTVTVITTVAGQVSGIAWLPGGQSISYRVLKRSEAGVYTAFEKFDLNSETTTVLTDPDVDVFPFRAHWLTNDTALFTASGKIKRLTLDESLTNVNFTATYVLDRPAYERKKRNYSTEPTQALGLSNPVVSNDGMLVAFSALSDLYLLDRKNNSLTNLTNDKYADQNPVFSPDDTKILFHSDRNGAPGLWLYDLSTSTAAKIDSAPALTAISFTPDGESIAGFMTIPGSPLGSQLVVINLATGAIAKHYKPIPPTVTSWSADGRYVATNGLARFSSRYREGTYTLIRIDTQSGEVTHHQPARHENFLDAKLIGEGTHYTYALGATLWMSSLDADEAPQQLVSELADMPSVSGNGQHAVYMSGDKMMYLDMDTGVATNITPTLAYARQSPTESWVLRIGRLFDGQHDGWQEDVDVVIDGNRIREIVPRQDQSLPVVDMSDKAVIPGLFEMHAHMGGLSEVQGRTWLAYGVTTVRDPGSIPYLAKARQEAWDAGVSIGPRTHVTGYLFDGNRVFYTISEGILSDDHLDRALQRTQELQLDFIKTYVRLPDEWQAKIVKAAHKMGIPTSSHEIFPAVGHGMDHVEHIGGTSRRGYQPKVSQTGFVYDDVVQLLAKSGMGITPTVVLPGFALITREDDYFETPQWAAFYGPAARKGYQMFAKRMGATAASTAKANGKALRDLVAAQALVVTGTDAPFVPYGAGLHAELRLYVHAGLTPFQTLRAATLSSATAAGVADDLGTIEAGKLADLVVIDGDPLTDIRDADNVVMTVKDGVAYPLESLLGD